MNRADCLFCKIVDRQLSSAIVYESDTVVGFRDVRPQAPVHVLFVPKSHIANLSELKTAEAHLAQELILAANQVAKENKVQDTGYRLVINCKKDGGQTVDHLHVHLLGGRKMNWPPG